MRFGLTDAKKSKIHSYTLTSVSCASHICKTAQIGHLHKFPYHYPIYKKANIVMPGMQHLLLQIQY